MDDLWRGAARMLESTSAPSEKPSEGKFLSAIGYPASGKFEPDRKMTE
jgi:hypothetical protein